jgi:hypothetical protein
MIKGKAKAIKLGRMDDDGEIFCVEGGIYQFKFDEDNILILVEDEWSKLMSTEDEVVFGHDMTPTFFDEYFDVIEMDDTKILKNLFKMIDDVFDDLGPINGECHCNKQACPMAVRIVGCLGMLTLYECRLCNNTHYPLCTEDHEDVSNCPYFQARIKHYDA